MILRKIHGHSHIVIYALVAQESSLAASGEHPRAQLAELRSYVTAGLDPGPSLDTWQNAYKCGFFISIFSKSWGQTATKDTMLSDMRSAHLGPSQQVVPCDHAGPVIPEDVYYAISMGADIGQMPQDSLMTVTGTGETAVRPQKTYMQPGDFCIVAGKDRLPIMLGVMMGSVQHEGEENGLCFGCNWGFLPVLFGLDFVVISTCDLTLCSPGLLGTIRCNLRK